MTPVIRRARWGLPLVPLVLVLALALAGCSSGGGGPGGSAGTTTPAQADATVQSGGKTVQSAMHGYLTDVAGCANMSSPVVCLEAADRTLGDKIHAYANLLARHQRAAASGADLTKALNSSQILANSLEILGEAQPTQANYNQVLNTFNIDAAITQLQGDVTTLGRSLGK